MKVLQSKRNLLLIFVAICLMVIYVYITIGNIGHAGDRGYWLHWSNHIREFGMLSIYDSGANYFPLYLYMLGLFSAFFDNYDTMSHWFFLMHYVSFMFEIAGVFIVSRLLKKQYNFLLLLVFALLNYALCYNTLIWGQVDSILGFFIFASIAALWKNKYILGTIFIALALSFKLQAIIFLPVFGLYFLSKFSLKKLLLSCLVFMAVMVLTCLPFLIDHERFLSLKNVTGSLVDFYPVITKGAANFWSFLFPKTDLDSSPDSALFLGLLSYKKLGLLLFFTSSFFALFPLLKVIILNFKTKNQNEFRLDKLMLSSALVGLSFYMFNTQMHERYSHPVFLFLMCYSFLKKDFFPYILFSIAYFLNMESILQWGSYGNYHTMIYKRYFAGGLYFIVVCYLFFRLYFPKKSIQDIGKLKLSH